MAVDPWWYERAQRACWNDIGLGLDASQNGGRRDELQPDRTNENHGAESLRAFFLSLAEMRLIQNTAAGVQRTGLAAAVAQ